MRVIQNYLQTQTSYRTVSDSMYDKIGEWLTWYQNAGGPVVSEGAAESMLKYRRLGLAKKVCEDWADLLMNEGISVTAGSFDSPAESDFGRKSLYSQSKTHVRNVLRTWYRSIYRVSGSGWKHTA